MGIRILSKEGQTCPACQAQSHNIKQIAGSDWQELGEFLTLGIYEPPPRFQCLLCKTEWEVS